ncbi:hypothetical protein OG323_06490 [Streptomyces cyaneofuscatus]|uniref:hypothetical protein n=1 Tax=Streptomyces cyaneofuscatus TaxID=66883 RepID=UPI00386B6135|nr:hypothetical protein OG323_06490 [Streptomyces cyaneofuscatus]
MNDRTEYIAGLRAFADWLENNPTVQGPGGQRLLLALSTNSAVEEFAAQHNLTVVTDDEGNMSAELTFGPITYHAYGYVDFGQHVAAMNERRARRWAEEQGLEIRKAEVTA